MKTGRKGYKGRKTRRVRRQTAKNTAKTAANTKTLARVAVLRSPYTYINNPKGAQYMNTQRTLLGQVNILTQATPGSFVASTVPFFVQPTGTGLNNSYSGLMLFQLNQLPNISDYTNLFQLYMIKKIEMSIRCIDDLGNTLPQPTLYLTKIYQPSITSADINIPTMNQYQRVLRYQFSNENRECKFAIKPYFLNVISATTAGALAPVNPRKKGWIDTAYNAVNHYAVGYVIDNIAGSDLGVINFEIDFTFHLAFKATR